MGVDTNIMLEILPDEILLNILKYLFRLDLCNVALVNKKMAGVTLDPLLWNQLFISTKSGNINKNKIQALGISPMLNLSRFSRLETIKCLDPILSCENMQAIFRHINE